VTTLLDGDYQPGPQTFVWNGRTARGRLVQPGSYQAVLRVTSAIATATRALPLRVR
jgi:hypothetical protein